MILKLLGQIGAAVAAFFNFLNREIDKKHGRLEADSAAQTEVMKRMQDAENIRSGANQLDDNLLLAPEKRQKSNSVGGLPDLSANLYPTRGMEPSPHAWGRAEDQSPQRHLGAQLFTKPERWVNKVFIHCSDSDNPNHDNVEMVRHWHRLRGFNDIGYNFYINKAGQVLEGRSVEKIPAAQEGHNTGSIAICLGGRKNFSKAQFEALRGLCAEIRRQIPQVSFHGHCEVNKVKACPNFDYKKVLSGL